MKQQHIKIIIITTAIFGFLLLLFGNFSFTHIKVSPKDYDIQFSLWGNKEYSKYSNTALRQMNENNVKLYIANFPSNSTYSTEKFVENIKYWEDNYPNIKISINIHPSTGGFVWVGNSENTIAHAKQIITDIKDNSLQNTVFGICFDFELPQNNEGQMYIPIPNLDEYNKAISDWNDFFDWTDENAPKLEITSVCSLTLSRDIIDGDLDLHFLGSLISFNVPRFDKYITMIYRSFPEMTDTTYQFYMKIDSYFNIMRNFFGNDVKTGIIIGISGMTDYNANTDIYEYGEHIGNGFEVFAKDVLILKHFGFDDVTFFVGSAGYWDSVFEAYGISFFDDMDNYVNKEPFDFNVNIGKLGNTLINLELVGSPVLDILSSLWMIPVVIFLIIWIKIKPKNIRKKYNKKIIK